MKRPCSTLAFLVSALMVAAGAGCSPESQRQAAATNAEAMTVSQGDVTVSATVAPDEPTVADTIVVTFTVESPQSAMITWPDLSAALPDAFELNRERPQNATTAPSGATQRTTMYELTPLLAGIHAIPSLPFLIDDETILETTPIDIHVKTVLGEDAALAPRKEIAAAPPDYRLWAMIAGGAVAAMALLALVAFLVVRRLSRPAPSERRRPAHEIALAKLEALLAGDLLERRRYELFMNELANILRHFIEDRFNIHAPAQTTEEFLHHARACAAIERNRSDELASFLVQCDLVKFARANASRHDADEAVATVRRFIESNAQAPMQEVHAEAAS